MRKIVITLPYFVANEAHEITRMLRQEDVWRVHIRKPECSETQMRTLLEAIPAELRSRLTLHDCHNLAAEYGIGGIQLNSRHPEAPAGWQGMVSRSLHSIAEIADFHDDYAFISPIYPSISKPGYVGSLDMTELKEVLRSHHNIYALGGITADKFEELTELGFQGAAMLGAAWRADIQPDKFQLQFISHTNDRYDTISGSKAALRGGCRWIQLRMKGADHQSLITTGERLGALCSEYGATYIIDDHVELVDRLNADGVHLGKNDMPVAEARAILGPRRIIGATANTFEDLRRAVEAGADYVGVGPFRFTQTKSNLSPILGIEGYQEIVHRCIQEKITVPIVAIGGITIPDIADIMATGVAGIAASGVILNATDPAETTAEMLQQIRNSADYI
jgi:thiamine-phosphate pyrophosphorylase